jgi:hypothetical protein
LLLLKSQYKKEERMKQCLLTLIFLFFLTDLTVQAAEFSTSILKPTPLGPEKNISASFPQDSGKIAYYFSADVQTGELLTQISFKGQIGREKRVELALFDANANLISAYWIQGVEAQREAIRSFPIEQPGRQLLRVTVFGPETDVFRLEFGGSALPQPSSSTVAESSASTAPQTGQ